MGQPDLEVGRPAVELGQWEDRLGVQQDKAVVQQGSVLVAGTLKDDRLGLVGTVEGKAVKKVKGEGEWWKCGKMERSSQVKETVEETN